MSSKNIQFQPKDITISDDAWQKKTNFFHIETWYYDGIFTNNYSVVALVNVLTAGNYGFIQTGCYIYKDTNLVFIKRERPPYRKLYGPSNRPLIRIKNRDIISGKIDEKTNDWIYDISMGDNTGGFDLNLTKTFKPFKGKHQLGNWLVIPHFKINGVIHLDGKDIDVVGHGYHDHNAYLIFAPFLSRGYHFGKVPIDMFNVTWARIWKRFGGEEKLLVLNKNDKYISINPKDINFTIEKQIKDHGKIIPYNYSINVNNDILKLKLKIETLNLDYLRLPTINYWRYHIKCTGEIEVDSKLRKINHIDMSELLRFF
jgi:hypothetical protein